MKKLFLFLLFIGFSFNLSAISCISDTGCTDLLPVCDTNSETCVRCLDSAPAGILDEGCDNSLPICDTSGATPVCVNCLVDEDCSNDQTCDFATNLCIDTTPTCIDDKNGSDVDTGCTELLPACDTTNNENPYCVRCLDSAPAGIVDEGCNDSLPICDNSSATPVCVNCLVDEDCSNDQTCDFATNLCIDANPTCVDDKNGSDVDTGCTELLPACNTSNNENPYCVRCLDSAPAGIVDEGCNDSLPICDNSGATPICVNCLVDEDCSNDQTCDFATNLCIDIDPCLNIDCSNHGSCIINNGTTSCDCDDGYNAVGLTCIEEFCTENSCKEWEECNSIDGSCILKADRCTETSQCTILATPVCNLDTHTCVAETIQCDPICEEWEDCNNGDCILQGNRCNEDDNCTDNKICDDNHNCIDIVDPCKDITCSNHGECKVINNSTICECDDGYTVDGLECIKDSIDLCENITCETWMECNSTNGNCELKDGMCNEDTDCTNQTCNDSHNCIDIDLCKDITCSNQGVCKVINDLAVCECNNGYHVEGVNCINDSYNGSSMFGCSYNQNSNHLFLIFILLLMAIFIRKEKKE